MVSKNCKIVGVVLGLMGIVIFASGVFAQDSAPKVVELKGQSAQGQLPPGMDEAMMAKMKEYSTPNENHKVLDQFVGCWTYSSKWWMSSDAKVEESIGSSEVKWILDGRFVEQTVTGTSMNQPFEGRGITGFDNLKKEYTAVWLDNMATGMMISSGKYDAATKTFSEQGSFSCPLVNGPRAYRTVMKIVDDNTHIYEMYTNDKDGKEFKSMEITYTRKK